MTFNGVSTVLERSERPGYWGKWQGIFWVVMEKQCRQISVLLEPFSYQIGLTAHDAEQNL